MAQRKTEQNRNSKDKENAAAKKAGKPISLDESLRKIHKRHGKLLKKLAE